jgi:SAM-dependent methyltransferase
MRSVALTRLLKQLSELDYRFVSVTPETHAHVLLRSPGPARSLRDVLGWNRPFEPSILPPGIFEALCAAEGCTRLPDGSWRATVRVSSVGELLFVHSGFPTNGHDAVFFGPDSYRFARALRELAPEARRAVDIGCGSGVGGILLRSWGKLEQPVVLADINDAALELARVNAEHAKIAAECIKSDVLRDVPGKLDLIIANPPYLNDASQRAYRHGGGQHGLDLTLRILRESLARLEPGGTLLLYTGVAIVDGVDVLLASLPRELDGRGCRHTYQELDPDVFGDELSEPAYRDVERIAVIFLQITLR